MKKAAPRSNIPQAPVEPPPIVDDESTLDLGEEFGEIEDVAAEPILQVAAPPQRRAAKQAPAATPKITLNGHKGIRTMKILLEENPDIPPTGQFIGHNGNSYMLRPGIWVEVPMPIIEILNNAVMQVPDRDPITNQIVGWREKLRYPYRVAPGQMMAA